MRVTAWRVVGGVFTALVVIVAAVTAYSEIMWQGGLDGAAPTSLLRSQRTETVTEVYAFTSPTLIVRSGGDVRVDIEPGTDGQVTIRRELTWTAEQPDVRQFWNGRTLRIDVTCRSGCTAVYKLVVPAKVAVERPASPGIP